VKDVWAWVAAVVIACGILALLAYGRAEQRAYWAARTVAVHAVMDEARELPALDPQARGWRSR
jgi:hypothetical protein